MPRGFGCRSQRYCGYRRAIAQTTLGALLDAGATPLSVAEFNAEVVQRIVEGPTPTGGALEVMYAQNGTMQGRGVPMRYSSSYAGPTRLSVAIGKPTSARRICTAMHVDRRRSRVDLSQLPTRCQYWFKLGDKYFLADSDTDRSAKVLVAHDQAVTR